MPASFDLSGLQSRIAAVKAMLPAVMPARVTEAAQTLVSDPTYGEAIDPETQSLEANDMLADDIEQTDTSASIGILVLYDWVLEPGHTHCYDPDGHDCPTFAAGGPYTEATLPARPGDGTTPCGHECFCQLVPRQPTWNADGGAAMTQLGTNVLGDISNAWGQS